MKKILFWMNCYGAWDPKSRTVIETKGYNQYLNKVVEKVAESKDNIADFYISGGMLDSKSRTECDTVKPELKKRLKEKGININIKTDIESVTSVMIMEKFLSTWKNNYPDTTPILFVDEVRYEINCYTFKYFCNKLVINNLEANNVIIPIERLDNHPNSTIEKQSEKLEQMILLGVETVDSIERKERQIMTTS